MYNIHKKHPTVLENEPKDIFNVKELMGFEINAPHARAPLLEFASILRSRGDGYVKAGEEKTDLALAEVGISSESRSCMSISNDNKGEEISS